MRLGKLTPDHPDTALIRALNETAFPDNERVPVEALFRSSRRGRMDILGIYTEEGFAGFFAVRTLGMTAYIAFFAVEPEKRSRGIGGAALAALREYYSGRQIVADFESVREESGNPGQRSRRRDFYLRNGFCPTGYYMFYMKTEFEVFCSREQFDKADFEEMIADIHEQAPDFDPELYR